MNFDGVNISRTYVHGNWNECGNIESEKKKLMIYSVCGFETIFKCASFSRFFHYFLQTMIIDIQREKTLNILD